MSEQSPSPNPSARLGSSCLAAGGVASAILASSCCILPLALAMLGVSGAWIGNLTLLEPYRPAFVALATVFVGFGFWQVYFQPKRDCDDGACARPRSALITQIGLWLAAALVVLAATIDWWAPVFY